MVGGGRYYIFMTEFMWTHLDPREEAKVGSTRHRLQQQQGGTLRAVGVLGVVRW